VETRNYKATAILIWDIELPSDIDKHSATEAARLELANFYNAVPGVSVKVRVDKIKKNKTRLHQLAVYDSADVLKDTDKQDFIVEGETYKVRLNTHRYLVFKNNLSCVACGLTGTKMVLERYLNQTTPHFNLYAEEGGQLILMTKDHIQTKALGGKDRLSNYQTMCAICNNLKGSEPLPIKGIQELRKFHDEYKTKMARKDFSAAVRSIKTKHVGKLQVYEPKSEYTNAVDLNIYDQDGHFVAVSTDNRIPGTWIASLKAGSDVVILEQGETIKVKFGDSFFITHPGLFIRR